MPRLSGTALTLGMALAVPLPLAADPAISAEAERQIESVIETSLILTDSDAISLGMLQFDPGNYVGLESEDFGSAESVNRRRKIRTFVLPWHWQTGDVEQGASTYGRARLSYFEAEQDVLYRAESPPEDSGDDAADTSQSRVTGGYLGGGVNYKWTERWQGSLGIGAHLLHYTNDHDYNSALSQAAAGDTDGLLFNSSVNALVGEARARVTYQNSVRGLPWKFHSTYTYYAGDSINSNSAADVVSPETWSWVNGVELTSDMPQIRGTDNRLRFFTSRVDVGGGAERTLSTDHYYELGAGWLFELPKDTPWVDNLGISVSVNVGSALGGGNLSLLYNEKW
ncbi:MAG: Solitary outer membrane autotransporter beta-barrel domain [Marinobacter sp.]